MDHIVPIAVGGTHTWDNVHCACNRCNAKKWKRPLGQMGLAIQPDTAPANRSKKRPERPAHIETGSGAAV